MRKKLLIFASILFAFIFNIKVAHAAVGDNIVCSYGIRTGDDASTWKQRFVINVSGAYNNAHIDAGKSNFIKDEFEVPITNFKEVTGQVYKYTGDVERPDFGADYTVQIYLSLYPNETVYNNLKGECPPVLKLKTYVEGDLWYLFHYMIYNDELDETNINEVEVWNKDLKEDLTAEYDLIEEGSKDISNKDLIDQYNCVTYSSTLNEIKKAVDASDSKSCDDNPEFSRLYQNLSSVCESYRATSMYAKDEGSEIVAKACSKACTMLNDDIASICKDESTKFGSCGSLGRESTQWLFRLVRIVRYSVPALIVILSILEFIKAIASESDDEMKKVTGRFTKRLIAAVLLFLIPFVLDFILAIFDIPGLDPTNPFCAK